MNESGNNAHNTGENEMNWTVKTSYADANGNREFPQKYETQEAAIEAVKARIAEVDENIAADVDPATYEKYETFFKWVHCRDVIVAIAPDTLECYVIHE